VSLAFCKSNVAADAPGVPRNADLFKVARRAVSAQEHLAWRACGRDYRPLVKWPQRSNLFAQMLPPLETTAMCW